MRQYYIHDGHAQQGPFALDELKYQKLSNTTPVWYDGLVDWTTVENLQELRSLVNTPPTFKTAAPQPPPPRFEATSAEGVATETKKKSFMLPASITGGLIIASFVGWLLYNNQTQASQIEFQSDQIYQVQQVQEAGQSAAQAKEDERKRINEAITKKNMEYRNNWSSYIGVGDSRYATSGLGGVDPFEIPVINKTDYLLDEVQVAISYIKANGGLYETEIVSVYNIPARSERSVQSKGSSRGTSVSLDITGITSSKMHFCYPSDNGNSEDPFFCK